MIRDLRIIIDGWEYEPGKISVRKIIGRDGREKIQTRIDMGLLQMEPDGPPDGQRIGGYDSVLERLEADLRRHIAVYGDDQDFVLSPEQCADLRREAYLYYQRYLSLFVLEDYERVARDTARNLRAIELCMKYAASAEDRASLAAQRGYVLMMHARSRACAALRAERYDDAVRLVTEGVAALRAASQETQDEQVSFASEMRVLEALREEIMSRMPPDSPARLRHELQEALEGEDYERAALLRDRLTISQKEHKASFP
ncbi:MAG: hypothetical protein GX547_13835 [Phycisphaerae bacterium]|nr:hypothetical protein [Phycisphaerae bacterium]